MPLRYYPKTQSCFEKRKIDKVFVLNSRLLFMTYNGWVMISVGVGAFVGYLVFGNNLSSARDGACH